MAVPGKRLRFQGSLGPFQELPVIGVMTISLVPIDAGTEAVVAYRLSGDDSQKLGDLAAVVDPVILQQFAGFAMLASEPRK